MGTQLKFERYGGKRTNMKTVIALMLCVAAVTAFDCYRQNNTCTMSHMKCDTGYEPFCEHIPMHEGPRIGFCTCDKACNAAADCANVGEDGCPPMSHPTCDMMHHVCHCFSRPPHMEGNRT